MTDASSIRSTVGIAALVVAGGRGTRVASGRLPKQYVTLAGATVLAHTLRPLIDHPRVDCVLVVRHADDAALYEEATAAFRGNVKLRPAVVGGKERQDSVRAGLEALVAMSPASVLIQDAARPFLSVAMLDRLLAAVDRVGHAILASPMSDTVKRAAPDATIATTVPRADLWRAETPQAFRFDAICAAHAAAARSGRHDFTDDASIAEWAGLAVSLVDSGGGNTKITTAEDLIMAEQRLAALALPLPDVRTGQGFDVHQFCDGDHVWLGGIRIAHTQGVDAHSDGDVVLHALTDALLGTIADGDIGLHFKNTDPRWRGASSDRFLADAIQRVHAAGGTVTNVDMTVLCEAPKVSPHRDAMRQRIAEILGIDLGRVSIKATTTETLGFTGRREGLAALATATVVFASRAPTSASVPDGAA
jgi:2-C-methyl-D-erythritol 4-phosphate cytidylyltransferase / 2-C-methyl-D-erythritol 2,4-cyclodiphosphate synthase